jgi:hypothetical protein
LLRTATVKGFRPIFVKETILNSSMAIANYQSIDNYIAAHTTDEQKVLQKMREIYIKLFPKRRR